MVPTGGSSEGVAELGFSGQAAGISPNRPLRGTVKLTDLRTYSASWTLPQLLILRSRAARFRLQNPRIPLNLTVPVSGIVGAKPRFCSKREEAEQE